MTINIKYSIVDVSTIGGNMNLSRLISILHNQKNSYMNVQLKAFGLSHGQAITLKIIYEENYRNGRRDGVQRYYYTNGKVSEEYVYNYGKEIEVRRYDENGNLKYERKR